MNRFSAALIAALLAVASPAIGVDEEDVESGGATTGASEGKGVSYSYYLISCGAFVKHRESGQLSDANNTADTFYVAGWLSAYNRLKFTNAIPEDTTLDDVMLWLEEYCTDHPLSNLEAGLFSLAEEVRPRTNASVPPEATKPEAPTPATPVQNPATPYSAPPARKPMEGLKPLTY